MLSWVIKLIYISFCILNFITFFIFFIVSSVLHKQYSLNIIYVIIIQ